MARIEATCLAGNPDGCIRPSRIAMAWVRASTGVARPFLSRTRVREAMAQRYFDAAVPGTPTYS
jgi:hypothetical protein